MRHPAGGIEPLDVPATAAGPDLRQLLIGSEGTLGIITEATVRVRPQPAERRYESWSFKTWEAGADAFRELEQSGATSTWRGFPTRTRRASPLALHRHGREGARRVSARRGHSGGCLAIIGFEGDGRIERAPPPRAGDPRAAAPCRWAAARRQVEAGRFHGPYLRDELMARGVFIDTLETVTTWSNAMRLYAAVRGGTWAPSLTGARPDGSCATSRISIRPAARSTSRSLRARSRPLRSSSGTR